jgi:carbamate kinase
MTSQPAPERPLLVVALGGNAILRRGERGTIEQQFAHARDSLAPVAALVADGARVVVTHGNGPVVGNIVERNEAAREHIPPMPLWIADADSQGGIGVMLQMTLHNLLRELRCDAPVATVVTQVVVDPADRAFERPTKPIGPWYDEDRARELGRIEGWVFHEEPGCGWRRVVPSPEPRRVVEGDAVAALLARGDVVIAAGGGGIPVTEEPSGALAGIDAVVDKDATSSLLAVSLDADALVILMAEDRVSLGWGTPRQRSLEVVTAEEAWRMLAEGDFAEGSMAPKIASAAAFAAATGRDAVICSPRLLERALRGEGGTRITAR